MSPGDIAAGMFFVGFPLGLVMIIFMSVLVGGILEIWLDIRDTWRRRNR